MAAAAVAAAIFWGVVGAIHGVGRWTVLRVLVEPHGVNEGLVSNSTVAVAKMFLFFSGGGSIQAMISR